MTTSLADGIKMTKEARRTGCKLMVYQPHRYRGEFLTFQKQVRGKLGVIFQSLRIYDTFNRRNDWTVCGGGMLNNYGAHYIDQFLAAFGPGKMDVCGTLLKRAVGIGDAEDVVNVLLRSPEGVCGKVEINLGSAFPEDSWLVNGQCGSARYSAATKRWDIRWLHPGELPELSLQRTFAAKDRQYSMENEIQWHCESITVQNLPQDICYRDVFAFFAENASPAVTLEESLELLRILECCRWQSAEDFGQFAVGPEN